MTVLKHWTFIVMILIGGSIYVLQRIGVDLPLFLNNYLNDILSIPITLFIILAVVQLFKGKVYKLSIWMIMFIVAYYAIYFEYYLPQFHPRYTSDLLDIGCYMIGGIIFYLIQRYLLAVQP
ncbi:hypothetical protein SAMN04488018_10181 [Myroides marinus]|uniref:Magnesium citrate secondary transporter n=1 Tax=Myroides marinus TaxID=703342 RepID=A0A1H6RAM6_9FLAO|nr:hypothetical protein [Myroides marinus]SEI48252.1 hypothetical protein SAMN04488018_10181 [Myroides marinus]